MYRADQRQGAAELANARRAQGPLFVAVALFSVFINLLMLTGPLYMLQVYDRVLGSQSEATLVALSAIVILLFLAMGVLDAMRARILSRIGARFQESIDRRAFSAAIRRLMVAPDDGPALAAQQDVEAVQRLWSSPLVAALADLPWTPIFIAAIFVLHPLMGWLSVAGAILILLITLANQWMTRGPLGRANAAAIAANRSSELLKAESETLRALGMTEAAFDRWQQARSRALADGILAADSGGGFAALSRTFRLFLQSAMLGLGAWVVLQGELTGGAMIAGSILMGRALQPIEQAVAQWSILTRAREGMDRLATLLSTVPPEPPRTDLPRPAARLEVAGISVAPPGSTNAALRGLSFALQPGQAVGVIGPSGAGKSTLARALTGIWRPAAGHIRLDGATLDQFPSDRLGQLLGYLPQRVTLFDGTIAENIARLQQPDDDKVIAAAQAAAAHDMILRLPDGYNTRLNSLGGRLSGGQMQRIALARALYGNPVLLILDEPNSNLDNEGSLAVNSAIRAHKAAGGAVLIMAHRPAAIQECDLLLVIEEGARRAFGPRDQILREMVQNANEITRSAAPGGVR
ncbi:type I secretion system permease/ATPase [Rhodobacteraceae bacterium HSP-20]|uniref:Type I secretion system permease/ATPase n=1 Tax=Paragemmobacter amnigenus TaxID=2852097 RepID=A0ABS6J2X0_9RHOB|nr:type I secretion system permease/ATPase [Rhodobacter amnigenus]MBU9697591.1 type I secretion system permease/ATPase [Rhodobacter amnigenus]MBV4388818.1 type I secretion system permease/ATPase [Rhodobacter amnigenus]